MNTIETPEAKPISAEMRAGIHRILDMCLDAKTCGVDIFCEFAPHTNQISIRAYRGEWEPDNRPEVHLISYLDDQEATGNLVLSIAEAEETIREFIRSVQIGRETAAA